jgi:hypothetical protein
MLFYFLRKKNNANQKITQPPKHTKNKWLYPTDSFGKLEKGVVYDSETYNRKTMPPIKHSELNDIEAN